MERSIFSDSVIKKAQSLQIFLMVSKFIWDYFQGINDTICTE